MQELQKAQLQHVRPERVRRIEAFGKACQILIRQAGDEVDVNVNIPQGDEPRDILLEPYNVRFPPDRRQRLFIEALKADLQLEEPPRGRPEKRQRLRVQKVPGNLEMEADTPGNGRAVIIDDKPENLPRSAPDWR